MKTLEEIISVKKKQIQRYSNLNMVTNAKEESQIVAWLSELLLYRTRCAHCPDNPTIFTEVS